jgi:hypothetical protein
MHLLVEKGPSGEMSLTRDKERRKDRRNKQGANEEAEA